MIKLDQVFDSGAIAVFNQNEASNAIPYLGTAWFPNQRKASIELKWLKTASGLPVSLAPSGFDAKSTIRTRKGFGINKEEMAFFRESMTISEKDRIELAKLSDITSPFVKDVVNNIFNDVKTLTDAADVVPERMRMQLLFPETAGPAIYISANKVTWSYNYDPDGTWAAKNRTDLSGGAQWANTATAKPLTDIQNIVENANEPIRYLLMSQAELNLMMATDQVKNAVLAQNLTATVFMTSEIVKTLVSNLFPGVEIIVYKKKFKEEDGTTKSFVPNGYVAFLPEGKLGNTWFGMTPEELAQMEAKIVDVTILPSGVAVAVQTTYNSGMQTETTVAETLLPSYERMDSVYLLATGTAEDAGGELDNLTVTSVAGTATGDTKITVSPTLTAGNIYKYKVADNATLPNYEQNVKLYSAWDGTSDITAATGKEIVIVECDSNYLAKKAGIVTVTAKA